jgi:hypothetical protein
MPSVALFILVCLLATSRLLACCRRNMMLQQVGCYLGYSGRRADAFEKAARDPQWTFRSFQRVLRVLISVRPGASV